MPAASVSQLLDQAFAHHSAGRLQEARSLYLQILQQNPSEPDALNLLGVLAYQTGRGDIAQDLLLRAIAANPREPSFYCNLAEVYRVLQLLPAALDAAQRALALKPDYPDALLNLANVLSELRRPKEAQDACLRAIALRPEMAEAHNTLGSLYQSQLLFDKATEAYRHSLSLNPQSPHAWNNLGSVLAKQSLPADAQAAFEKAVALDPNFTLAYHNRALCLQQQGKFSEAIAAFENALRLNPNLADAHWGLAVVLLGMGDFARGWEHHERRWQPTKNPLPFPHIPLWSGQPLAGKSLLLHCEQGFGDSLQFIRYFALVTQLQPKKIFLHCPPQLAALFQSTPTLASALTFLTPDEPPPPADFHCPLLSLPRAFKTTLDTIPNNVPYLCAPPDLVTHFQTLLASSLPSPLSPDYSHRIGLVFAGSPTHIDDSRRSLKLTDLAPLFQIPNAQFISLQLGPAATQIKESGLPLFDFSAHLKDFAHTAALIANLDLVISVDTAVAHLAGALAKPTWLLLPHLPDWRWLLHRNDSPWYPTIKLFRQPSANNWPAAIAQLTAELQTWKPE